jgi:hypothetical protein
MVVRNRSIANEPGSKGRNVIPWLTTLKSTYRMRELWSQVCNEAIERSGKYIQKTDPRSYAKQSEDEFGVKREVKRERLSRKDFQRERAAGRI